jgi:hypothetical protein
MVVIRGKRYKFTQNDIRAGTQHEMEHTKSRKEARQIAMDHLREHPTYYKVLPIAEAYMTAQERKSAVPPKKRRRRAPPAPGLIPDLGLASNPFGRW